MFDQEAGPNQFAAWDKLLREFDKLTIERKQKLTDIETLLFDFEAKREEWKDEQKCRADNFNALATMGLARDELCNSDILGWLLDSKGTHAQGNLGFKLFLIELNLPEKFADMTYHVRRELPCEESRIDIVIESNGGFIIGIENKIDALEGYQQTQREWRDLQRRKAKLNVKSETLAFFLTPDNAQPLCTSFRAISWQIIAKIFEAFADQAKAPIVKIFTKHYAESLRKEIIIIPEENYEFEQD